MRRREFVILGSAVAAWPLAAGAQQATKPVIGFLSSGSERAFAPQASSFLQGLKEMGYVDKQNVAITYRWAEGQYDRLAMMADDLVRAPVTVLAASGGTAVARAAKSATASIPIVFATADDPVATGLVTSLNRPGGNLTGVSLISGVLSAKNLELLHELVPTTKLIAVLVIRTVRAPRFSLRTRRTRQIASALELSF